MSKFFLSSLLLALAPWVAPAQTTPTAIRQALPLRAVTLYLDAAELQHEGSATLPAGAVDVRVTGLAPALTDYALQADATGAELEGLELVAGSPRRTVGRDTLGRRRHEIALLSAEKEFLKQNTHADNNTPGRWAEETLRAGTAYSARLVQIDEQLAALGTAAAADVIPPDLLLHLQVPRAGQVRLRVSYRLATAAPWRPTYELRVSEPNLRQLRVVSRAALRNDTGLPWTNLPVTLRTNTPSAQTTRPALDPWTVAFGRAGNEGEGNLDDFAVKGPGTPGTAAAGPAAAPDLGASLRLPAPVTLPAGGAHTYVLGDFTLPMRLEYLAIPKKDEEVFLVGRVSDWNQVNFLAETATIFYRGTYVGTTDLDTRAYTDTLEVSFGRDPQVQLTRTKREDFEGPISGGSRTRARLGYEINVKNTHPYAVRLRLLDQLPVSQEKEITVKPIDLGGAALDEPSGKLTWLFSLAPGASRRFPIAFTVEAPAAQPINLRRDRRVKSPKFR
ncbi:mucoidy inhibitor MuiA family protein [Hymenobacter bucti]|uniref:Mucoidy inhibitor MuiA family protein n=1 Tax=Hymenobacter bucti TaxID=1844114 RepID=A0ABW4QQX9_9BACT